MNESQGEAQQPPQSTEKKEKKSIFQEIWGRFKEGIGRLLGKTDEKLVKPQTEKATEIAEKTKTECVKEYFKTQAENFRNSIRVSSEEISAGSHDFLAGAGHLKIFLLTEFPLLKAIISDPKTRESIKKHKDEAKVLRNAAKEIRDKKKR